MEHILIVDENDNLIGEEEKGKCHEGDGILHRAILVMVFNRKRELLLARRSKKKRLWPGFWDGTVASHVFKEENYEQASKRRLSQEIGLITDNIEYLFKFRYKAEYKNVGAENEICAVVAVNNTDGAKLSPNPNEVSEMKSMDLRAFMDDLKENKNRYTPWLMFAVEHMIERQLL
jgi:isopentenyl-diphosphate delta-isomerase